MNDLDRMTRALIDCWPIIFFLCCGVASIAYAIGKAQNR